MLAPARSALNALIGAAATQVHRARIIDLVEVRTIERADAREAFTALSADSLVDEPGARPLDAIERALASAGGGRALLASAPEEVLAAACRLVLRGRVLGLADAMAGLRSSLAKQALGHLTTAVTVTSNGQMVQPTTLGHYLTGFLGPLGRTSDRLGEAFRRLNRSPLGAVSGMATAVPSRRERQAELLGFDSAIEHTFDALAATDVQYELLTVNAGLSLELLRLINDLSQWARDDTGTIVPSAEFVHSGGAQPQRRDPLILEHLQMRLTGHASAASSLATALLNRSMIPGPVSRQQAFASVESELGELALTVRLLARVLDTLEVNRALTANRTHKGFATSSELADLLAIDYGLTRTEAYELGERIATEATVLALGGMTLDTKLVDKLALEVIGREVGIEPETLGKCLSVKRFVERREVPGGPAPSSVRAMIEREHLQRRRFEDWIKERREQVSQAEETLTNAVNGVMG